MGYKVNLNTEEETEKLYDKLSELGITISMPGDEEEKNKKKEDNSEE